MMKSTVPCDGCCGRGVVPHERRTIDGVIDPWDQQVEELCLKCGGNGKMPAPGPGHETPPTTPVVALSSLWLDPNMAAWWQAHICDPREVQYL